MRGRTAAAIAASIEAAIRTGALGVGERLPTIRRLAADLGASHVTVANAYRRLGERGLLVAAGRAGTRVASPPPLPVRPQPPLAPHLVDLVDGNPDPKLLPPLPRFKPDPGAYGAASVDPVLDVLIRRDFAADGVDGKAVTVAGGALDGIERILTVHLRHGDRVGVEDPGFPRVIDLVSALGLRAEPIAVDQRGVLPSALEAALKRDLAALIVTPRAQNPTGAALDGERVGQLSALLDFCPRVLVIEDDHAASVAGAEYVSLSSGRARWAVVRSYSKALGPDLRLAALAGDAETIARVAGRLRLGPGWVSHILQQLAASVLEEPETLHRLTGARDAYGERRAALVAALAAEGVEAWGRSGLNVWVPVAEETATVQALFDAGYAVAAGERFRLRSPRAVRVTISRLLPRDAPAVAAVLARSIGSADRAPAA